MVMPEQKNPKYHLITYGCQMNKNDSERAAALLRGIGFSPTVRPEEADFILINTCSVRQTAEDRVYGQMKHFARLRARKPRLLLGVTGCMPGRDRDGKLSAKLPMIDFFFPIADLPQLPRWIAEHEPTLVQLTDAPEDYLKISPARQTSRQAFVTIQTGCNKFCTYCVVPFARGLEKNRPLAEILSEICVLAEQGCVEVTLLGQTINSYRAPDSDNFSSTNPYFSTGSRVAARDAMSSTGHFAALLWEVNQVPGIERVHFTAPHPIHMTAEVIDALALPKQVKFLHLPVQSGSNEILRRMNRRYTREEYLELVRRIREKVPDIALGTDIIVGFSGETEEQFEETVELYRQADFDIAYIAQYSPRSGTAASRAFPDTVSREEKKRRWNILQKLMEETVLRKNQFLAGKTVRVLVESVDERGVAEGNCEYMKRVRFSSSTDHRSPTTTGDLVEVAIMLAREWVLDGKLV
ncbi:tRNA (N6-isopentenyl adenosine(37)-C2)-methylthiotransferase MiaB [Patescibacteria group bacterium]|nr:MAG: tRNA (N6-isopentenyl adenosine(37)-C2)-methylthiotransferase MiaB [Patescibacteria group bacterium]